MRSRGLFLAGLGAIALAASPALARELPCGESGNLAQMLDQSYGEVPISTGLQGNGQLLQIYASPATGSWTAVTTSPRGVSCVVATGQGWADKDPALNVAAQAPAPRASALVPFGPR
jgi:hypothetical protein